MHMDALVALVRLWGGLEFLGFGGVLQMFISRYATFGPPQWLRLTHKCRLDLIFAALTTSEFKLSFPSIKALSKDVATQRTLRSNPHLLERLPQDQFDTYKVPDASSIVFFGKKRSSICHRLISCSPPVKKMKGNFTPRSLFEPCKIAALIFMEYLLAGTRPRAEVLQSLELKLTRSTQSALEKPGIEQAWDDDTMCARVILWVYFIGGLTASNTVRMQWYASRIGRAMLRLHFKTQQGLKACLVDMIWTEQMHDQAFEKLWEEIQRAFNGYP